MYHCYFPTLPISCCCWCSRWCWRHWRSRRSTLCNRVRDAAWRQTAQFTGSTYLRTAAEKPNQVLSIPGSDNAKTDTWSENTQELHSLLSYILNGSPAASAVKLGR